MNMKILDEAEEAVLDLLAGIKNSIHEDKNCITPYTHACAINDALSTLVRIEQIREAMKDDKDDENETNTDECKKEIE